MNETKPKIDWDELQARTEHPEDFGFVKLADGDPSAPWNIWNQMVHPFIRTVRR